MFVTQWDDLDSDEQIAELERCTLDFFYFSDKYIRITHPERGLIPFKLFDYQKRCIADFGTYKHNIMCKFRQGGLTTLATLWSMWRCMFKPDQRILVLSKSDREAKHAGSIVTNALLHMPDWLKPEMALNNAHEKIFLDTNSNLEFYTPEAARSKSLTYLIVDEAAFIKNMDEHWKAMYPTISAGGRTIIISTVNGIGNWYEQMYHAAEQGKNQFHVIDIDYTEHPDYRDPKWVAEMKANLGPKGFAQEILKSFLGSGDTFIREDVLTRLELQTRKSRPVRKMFPELENLEQAWKEKSNLFNEQYEKGALWVYKLPERRHEYILCADVANGLGEGCDNSAFHVLDYATGEQVAEFYSDNVPPYVFAQVIHNVGTWYFNALVVVENMGPGLTVLERLVKDLYYENLYYESRKSAEKPGVTSTLASRQLFLESLQTALTYDKVTINSPRLLYELNTFNFNKKTRKAQAVTGKHDDLVIALAILVYIKERIARDVPVGSPVFAQENADISKSEIFQKIKREIEGGLADDLLEEDEVKTDEEVLRRVMFNNILERRPFNKLLSDEFGW